MGELHLPDNITKRLQAIAEQEHRSIEEVLAQMLQNYSVQQPVSTPDETSQADPLVGLIGLLDDETQATDLSSTVRETLAEFTHPKYGWTKRDRTD